MTETTRTQERTGFPPSLPHLWVCPLPILASKGKKDRAHFHQVADGEEGQFEETMEAVATPSHIVGAWISGVP